MLEIISVSVDKIEQGQCLGNEQRRMNMFIENESSSSPTRGDWNTPVSMNVTLGPMSGLDLSRAILPIIRS